jgi:hypothetical protein
MLVGNRDSCPVCRMVVIKEDAGNETLSPLRRQFERVDNVALAVGVAAGLDGTDDDQS